MKKKLVKVVIENNVWERDNLRHFYIKLGFDAEINGDKVEVFDNTTEIINEQYEHSSI